ncbi:MAG: hypothetical protein ABIJ18_00785 [archaeon]
MNGLKNKKIRNLSIIILIIMFLPLCFASTQTYSEFIAELEEMGFEDTSFIKGCENAVVEYNPTEEDQYEELPLDCFNIDDCNNLYGEDANYYCNFEGYCYEQVEVDVTGKGIEQSPCSASSENREITLRANSKLDKFYENIKNKNIDITFEEESQTISGEGEEGLGARFSKGILQSEGNKFNFVGGEVYFDGYSEIDGKFTNTKITAQDYTPSRSERLVNFNEAVNVDGKGSIEDGLIISIEGYVYVGNMDFYVKGGELTKLHASRTSEIGLPFNANHLKGETVSGEANNLHICNAKDDSNNCIIIDKGLVLISPLGVECETCTYQVYGSPKFKVVGYSGIDEARNIEAKKVRLGDSEKEYEIAEAIRIKDGHFVVPENSVGMVEGIYVSTKNEEIPIYIQEENTGLSGNYIRMSEKELELNGEGYAVALGNGVGGRPTKSFDFNMDSKSNYLPNDEKTYRLVAEMDGGNVIIDKANSEIITNIEGEGNVNIINGGNKIEYVQEGYAYQYIPCEEDITIEQSTLTRLTGTSGGKAPSASSCAEVPFKMYDGGKIDVVESKSSIYYDTIEDQTIGFSTKEQGTQTFDLNTGEVYVLGYKGGEAAEALVGKEKASEEWGHVGLMYYKDEQWWVGESDGKNTKIVPYEESLFVQLKKLDGIKKVNTEYPNQVIQSVENLAGSYYEISDGGIYCSSLIEKSLSAAEDIENPTLSIEDTDPAALNSRKILVTILGINKFVGEEVLDTPGEIMESQYLEDLP